MRLGRERQDALLLDLACCVGNDARKAVSDGWPAERVVASDLHAEFWEVGHRLFRSTADSCTIRFIAGDLFSDDFLSPSDSPKDLSSEQSVNSFKGSFAAIHVAAFFHLFPLAVQRAAVSRILTLLSRAPGSIIFGSNIGADVAGASFGRLPYLHNPDSWRELWDVDADAFEVRSELRTIDTYLGGGVPGRRMTADGGSGASMKWLVWSVRRK